MLNPATVRRQRHAPTARRVRLPDGARIGIRPIRAQDAEAFARAYARLSERSRHRRFLSLAPALRPAEVRYLTSVDHHDHVALVALDHSREILGSARYIRIPLVPASARWRSKSSTADRAAASDARCSGEGRVFEWLRHRLASGHGADPVQAARLIQALAAGRADRLSGRHIRVADELNAMLGRIEKIERDDLHTLRLRDSAAA